MNKSAPEYKSVKKEMAKILEEHGVFDVEDEILSIEGIEIRRLYKMILLIE